MGRKGIAWLLLGAGLGLVALSLTADAIGLGAGDFAFGLEQKIGVAIGATAAWFGGLALLGWQPLSERKTEPVAEAQRATLASA
jgi:hypothetical protein